MHHSSAPKADHANDDGEDDTRVAMLAMIMAGLSTMSPYTNHSSKATETSPKVGKEMPSWR